MARRPTQDVRKELGLWDELGVPDPNSKSSNNKTSSAKSSTSSNFSELSRRRNLTPTLSDEAEFSYDSRYPPVFSPSSESDVSSIAKIVAMRGNAFAQRKELAAQKQGQEARSASSLSANQPFSSEAVSGPPVPPKPDGKSSININTLLAVPMPKQQSRQQHAITAVSTEASKDSPQAENESSASEAPVSHPSALPPPLFSGQSSHNPKPTKKWSMKGKNKKGRDELPAATEKDAKMLDVGTNDLKMEEGNQFGRDGSPKSAPVSGLLPENSENSRSTFVSSADARSISGPRLAPANPDPASKRYYLEKMGPNTPTIIPDNMMSGVGSIRPSNGSQTTVNEDDFEADHITPKAKVQGMMLGDPSTSPTRHGTYGKVGQAELHAAHSVASIRGVIDHVSPNQARFSRSFDSLGSNESNQRQSAQQQNPSLLLPAVYQPGHQSALLQPPGYFNFPPAQPYSPSVYSAPGVWDEMKKNHPDSMPSFESPVQGRFSQENMRGTANVQPGGDIRQPSSSTTQSFPITFQGQASELTPSDGRPVSLDYRLSNGPIGQGGFVPTPNHPDFHPSGGPAEQSAFQFTTMQFHIDGEFRRLAMLIDDSKNEVIDRLLRRVDEIQSNLNANIVGLIHQVKHLSEAIHEKVLVNTTTISSPPVSETLHKLHNVDTSIDALVSKIGNIVMEIGDIKNRDPTLGPVIVDGSGQGYLHQTQRPGVGQVDQGSLSSSKPAVGNGSTTPQSGLHSGGCVDTPVAAYPTPARAPGGNGASYYDRDDHRGSQLDPKAFAFQPPHSVRSGPPPPFPAMNQGIVDNGIALTGPYPASPYPAPVLTPAYYSFHTSSTYPNPGPRHGAEYRYHGYNPRRSNEGYRPRSHESDGRRNASAGTAIYISPEHLPEPDIRDHPAFARSPAPNPPSISAPENITSSQENVASQATPGQIPVVHASTCPPIAPPMPAAFTTPLWAGTTDGWSGHNWYHQAYGQGQRQENVSRGGPNAEKRLFDWNAPADQGSGNHHPSFSEPPATVNLAASSSTPVPSLAAGAGQRRKPSGSQPEQGSGPTYSNPTTPRRRGDSQGQNKKPYNQGQYTPGKKGYHNGHKKSKRNGSGGPSDEGRFVGAAAPPSGGW